MVSPMEVTLISTRHDNIGKCNSSELCQLLEQIRPEVIFEEKPPSNFDAYYLEKTRTSLETQAIISYIASYNANHILVDSENLPSQSFFREHENVYKRIEGLADINGFNYRNAVDCNKHFAATHGFNYLNSDHCVTYNERIREAIDLALKKLNHERFFQIENEWRMINDRRENEMLENIYKYSNADNYKSGVFLLGAAHRKSIIKKIENCEDRDDPKLNWCILSFDS